MKSEISNSADDSLEVLRKAMNDFLELPEKFGDAVASAFILKNLSSFKEFLSTYPKKYEVAGQRWIMKSLDLSCQYRVQYEAVVLLAMPENSGEIPSLEEWGKELVKQKASAENDFFSKLANNSLDLNNDSRN